MQRRFIKLINHFNMKAWIQHGRLRVSPAGRWGLGSCGWLWVGRSRCRVEQKHDLQLGTCQGCHSILHVQSASDTRQSMFFTIRPSINTPGVVFFHYRVKSTSTYSRCENQTREKVNIQSLDGSVRVFWPCRHGRFNEATTYSRRPESKLKRYLFHFNKTNNNK